MEIRVERPDEAAAIRSLTTRAFEGTPHGSGTEAAIVDGLRDAGALTVSLVAVEGRRVIGHVAFSPVTIEGEEHGWHGLGPVSVSPARQRAGVGRALVEDGLARLRSLGSRGCVVLGDPAYYGRFGFAAGPDLILGTEPSRFFQRLAFRPPMPRGRVAFHPAFDAA